MACGCKGNRKPPDADNQKRQAQAAERRAAVEAARKLIAQGGVPEFVRRR